MAERTKAQQVDQAGYTRRDLANHCFSGRELTPFAEVQTPVVSCPVRALAALNVMETK